MAWISLQLLLLNSEAIDSIREIIDDCNSDIAIISKIENRRH